MILQKIFLENFRNHAQKVHEFSKKMTIFIGENGIGKTNILEGIFSLSTTKPFRSKKKEVFVMHKKNYGRVQAEISADNENQSLEIFWGLENPRKNAYKRNGAMCTLADFMQKKTFLAVLFSPEDMNLPILSPDFRRKNLSQILSPLFGQYFLASVEYEKIVKQRNALLKKFFEQEIPLKNAAYEIEFWNTQLEKNHEIIQKFRKIFFKEIQGNITDIYQKISGKNEEVHIVFSPNTPENFLEILQKNLSNDISAKRTLFGSHRDDYHFFLRGEKMEETASRGETRSVILAYKIAQLEFLKKHSGLHPVLLLDDVFSELDTYHQKFLLEYIKNFQSIITATHLEIDPSDECEIVYIKNNESL